MRIPFPSPKGTNLEKLFYSNPRGAYDEALSDEAATALMLFLKERLSESDFAEAVRLGKGVLDDGAAMDDERELDERMPTPRTTEQAADQARARLGVRIARQGDVAAKSFAERFPGAAKIKV